MSGLVIGIIIAVAVLVIIISCVATYNSLVKSKNNVEKAFADIDVVLKKRYDLIPNLVNTVKGYAKHEQETFTKVINLRAEAIKSHNVNEKVKLNNEITSSLGSLVAIAENYPNLKADSNFLSLQQSLSNIEDQLSSMRFSYNATVTTYNNKTETFPNSIIAKMFKFKQAELFVISNKVERENVKVEF